MIIALSLITNKFSLNTKGLDIFSLSIFRVEIVFPDLISITNNLPLLVDKYILFVPTINPHGLIIFLFVVLIFLKTSVAMIIFPLILSVITGNLQEL